MADARFCRVGTLLVIMTKFVAFYTIQTSLSGLARALEG